MLEKQTFVSLLSAFCKVYVDFWFIDELTPKRMSSEILNIVLDGSEADLDAKYGHLFEKRKNVPVMMACNQSPRYETVTSLRLLKALKREVKSKLFLPFFLRCKRSNNKKQQVPIFDFLLRKIDYILVKKVFRIKYCNDIQLLSALLAIRY